MRAVGYFRVGNEDQVNGYSLDAQCRNFFEFCQRRGWEAGKNYAEEGRSAWAESIDKRPTFSNMLDDSRLNQFDVVVVDTFDRFSRNMLTTMVAFQILTENHVAFACVKQDIDYSTPEGRLFMVTLGGFAQYFSDNLSTHTKKGMKERAQQGLFNGESPWGYERCDATCIGIDEGHTGCLGPRQGAYGLGGFPEGLNRGRVVVSVSRLAKRPGISNQRKAKSRNVRRVGGGGGPTFHSLEHPGHAQESLLPRKSASQGRAF